MRITGGETEAGIVVGNAYDKYGSRNPIVRRLMAGFEGALSSFVARTAADEIHEVGCGEGHWTLRWLSEGRNARGSDFSARAVDLARLNAAERGLPDRFKVASVYDLTPEHDAAQLVVCCEVLEHLERPREALAVLARLAKGHLIASVPREPLWRALNMARGKYWSDRGNTPGHIRHWSTSEFAAFVSEHFEIIEVRTPVPWTMVLARAKR